MLAVARTLLFALLALTVAPAPAQDYPTRPIRFVVGTVPGSVIDVWARRFAQLTAPKLGQPVVVENRPGASGAIAAQHVAQSAPDGYTLLFSGANEMVYAPATAARLPYDVERELVPIASGTSSYGYLFARPGLGATTLTQLRELAQKRGSPILCATAGNATNQHFGCAAVARAAGIDMQYLPYKGSAQALTDLAAGHADIAIGFSAELDPFLAGNRIVPLAMLAPTRGGRFPDLPTAAEQGATDAVCMGWSGVVAPRGIPAPVAARINEAIREAANDPQMQQWARQAGSTLPGHDVAASAEFIRTFRQKMTAVASAAGIKAPD